MKSNLVSECLGQLLVRERIISQRELEASIRDMKSSGAKQGRVLMKMGSISQKNLDCNPALQFETKVLEPFGWEQGEYRFNSGFAVDDLGLKCGWPFGSIIVKAYDVTITSDALPISCSASRRSRLILHQACPASKEDEIFKLEVDLVKEPPHSGNP